MTTKSQVPTLNFNNAVNHAVVEQLIVEIVESMNAAEEITSAEAGKIYAEIDSNFCDELCTTITSIFNKKFGVTQTDQVQS